MIRKLFTISALLFTIKSTSAQTVLEGNYIKVGTSGGIPPYRWKIDGGTFQNKDTFYNVLPGNHTITIADSKGCTRSTAVKLYTAISIATISYTTSSVTVRASNGVPITISGVSSYYYSINGGNYVFNKTSFTGLARGTYIIRARDYYGYVASVTITI
jgi:hypothetical protein